MQLHKLIGAIGRDRARVEREMDDIDSRMSARGSDGVENVIGKETTRANTAQTHGPPNPK